MDSLKKVQVYILDEVVEILDNHNIEYFLDGGTLLGAVRHSGFIPWDDDIDISIHINDLDKTLKVLEEKLPKDVVINVGDFSLDKIVGTPIKIEYVHSEITEVNSSEVKRIFIDLFVFSPNSPKYINSIWGRILGKPIVASRMNYFQSNEYRKKSNLFTVCLMELVKQIPDKYIEKKVNSIREKYRNEAYLALDYRTWAYVKHCHPIEKIYPLKKLKFEGTLYSVPNDYDDYLRVNYGNYMELPPIDQQKSHHIIEYKIMKMPINKKQRL